MKYSESAGGIVFNDKGEVIVVNQKGRSWSLPKGHIDPGEDPLDAAKREIYEESGVNDLEFVDNLGSYQRHPMNYRNKDDNRELKTIHMFLFKSKQEELKSLDPDNPIALWVDKDRVDHLLTHPKDKNFYLLHKSRIAR